MGVFEGDMPHPADLLLDASLDEFERLLEDRHWRRRVIRVGAAVGRGVVAIAIAEVDLVGLADVTGGQRGGFDFFPCRILRPVAAGRQRNIGCSADLANCDAGDAELLGNRGDRRGLDEPIELGAGESVGHLHLVKPIGPMRGEGVRERRSLRWQSSISPVSRGQA